eukprot:gene23765-32150_t
MRASESRHSESNLHLRRTVDDFLWLQKLHSYIMVVYIPLCLAVVIYSCIWSDIFGKAGEYSDLSTDWQACMVQADYAYIPLKGLISSGQAKAGGFLKTCVLTELFTPSQCQYNDTRVITCISNINSQCLQKIPSIDVPNVGLPSGHFLTTLSYIGVQCIVFSAIAHASLNRALRHPSWLVSTIGGLIWLLYSVVTFYTVTPAFPVPNQLNGTLLSLLYYGATYTKYSEFNNSDNNCGPAYRYLWGYLTIILLLVLSVFFALNLAIYAEVIRYKSKNREKYEPLAHAFIPCVLAVFLVIFYILMAVSKIGSTINELIGIAKFGYTEQEAADAGKTIWYEKVFYPFQVPALDISTVLFVLVFSSILRGYTIQSISAYRMAAVGSVAFVLVSYPAIVGAFQFYYYNDFEDYDTCWAYFQGSSTGFFGYPDVNESKFYCQMFRLSLVGFCGLFIMMHLTAVACFLTTHANSHRESEVLEPLESMQERLSMQSNKPSPTANPIIRSSLQAGSSSAGVKATIFTPAEAVYVGDRLSVDRPSYGDITTLKEIN